MYNFISGTIADKNENLLIIENNGIGYELSVSNNCLDRVGQTGAKAKVFVYLAVREDSMTLFGFYSKEEKATFLKLIGVSGIGPKLAILILSGISTEGLAVAIATGDVASLNKIKGVGKKTAERIVLELREKISPEDLKGLSDMGGGGFSTDNLFDEAVMALMALGISRGDASKAVASCRNEAQTIEQLLAAALRKI